MRKLIEYFILVIVVGVIGYIFWFSNWGYDERHEEIMSQGYYLSTAELKSTTKDRSNWVYIDSLGTSTELVSLGNIGGYKSGERFKIQVSKKDPKTVIILYDEPELLIGKFQPTITNSISSCGSFCSGNLKFTYSFKGRTYERHVTSTLLNKLNENAQYRVLVYAPDPSVGYVYLDSLIN